MIGKSAPFDFFRVGTEEYCQFEAVLVLYIPLYQVGKSFEAGNGVLSTSFIGDKLKA